MLYRPQGLLGMKELSFVNTFDKFVNWVKTKKNQPKVKKVTEKKEGGSDV